MKSVRRYVRQVSRAGVLLIPAVLLSAAAFAGAEPEGKAVFLKEKCNMCHAVPSAGIAKTMKAMKAPELTAEMAAKQSNLKEFLMQKAEINGKKHPKKVTGGEAELNALVEWLKAPK